MCRQDGVISGANITEYLLEKSRIVTHAPDERNYHVFYEMLAGLTEEQRQKFGLMTAEKYFYLNQGGSCNIDGKVDRDDFQSLLSAMQVLGFTQEEQEVIFKIISSILHLGNVYFHRKQLKHGQEGVEIGSDVEIKWAAHLLQLNVNGIVNALTLKTSEMRNENLVIPLNIDQALDARDAIAKALYSSLFTWLVSRLNKIISGKSSRRALKNVISILDIFGFEDFPENSFEQLCINYANENLQYFFNKNIFKMEQAEYAKEKIEWNPITFLDNQPIIHMLSKKPVGVFHLLDDESNFPKATDISFLEKCHYNHALNELYSRPRMNSMEFGIKHYAGQVWYNVEGFLDKNRDTLRYDVMSLMISSKEKMISKMFQDLRNFHEASKTLNKPNGQFVTMKPRTATVAARFHDSLHNLLGSMANSNPYFIRCLKPNNDKCPMKFDMPVVLEQLRYSGVLETIRIRKLGYPVRKKYHTFAEHYRCLIRGRIQRGAPTKEIARYILDQDPSERDNWQLGSTKVFMRESLEQKLEKQRLDIQEVAVMKLQQHVRGHLARRQYNTMKRNALVIQKTYRGWKVRKEYTKVRTGVVKLQALYKMKKQKSQYIEMKEEMKIRAETEKKARELARERAKKEEQEMERLQSRSVAGVNHLDVPAELAFVFSKLENWAPVNTEKNLAKVSGRISQPRSNLRLPSDIDYYVFSKVANIYFKSHLWQMRKEPIKTPFLSKSKESDYQESLAIFKLILRFMNDSQLSGQKEKILGDYIINKGIRNEKLRDEIYCQLANQTWKNDNEANCERGWMLMANCLSAFSPSKTLYKYLLKYVSDHAYNGFKSVCQSKLLKSGRMDPHQSRQFPPTVLEWRANKKRVNMALEVTCHDGETNHVPIDSLSTAHSFAARVLKDRGIKEYTGWSVALEDGTELVELNGDDFVLDAVGELELPPAFPANSSQFLVSHDRSRGQIPLTIDTKDRRQYRHSSSPRSSKSKDQASRSKSQDRLLSMPKDDKNFGLANSALNERYFSETKSTRSKSLDNLLPNENNLFGLSESKLNQRYLSQGNQFFERDGDDGSIHMESISQRGGKENWDDIGLSNNPLNDRYFSQPDLDRVAAGRAKSEERDLGKIGRSNSDRQSKMDNEDIDLEQFEYPTERAAGGNRRNMKYIKAHHAHRRRDGMRSSAMSDTSEAPSLASHVRRVRVPSQASDVDQFLDDLFMPVLDGNIDDGLSDARSLAASMRGGADDDVSRATNEILEFKRVGSIRRKSVLPQVTECETDCESLDEELNNLTKVSKLVTMIQGGGSPNPSQGAASPKKQSDFTPITSSAMGFHPIPGVISPHPISGMISPPLIMPTPIQGHQMFSMGSNMGAGGVSSPLLMQANESNPNQPAMAFTYVPVPVYNLGGVGMPMMPGKSIFSITIKLVFHWVVPW